LDQQGCILFNPYATDHGKGRISYAGRADVFGVFCPDTGMSYLVPLDAVASTAGRLRIEPTRNNQSRGVRYADQFEISGWTGERLLALLDDSSPIPQLGLEAA
jgi:PD-(D/E)XK endonuclease